MDQAWHTAPHPGRLARPHTPTEAPGWRFSLHNADRPPERMIHDVHLLEFGPVTFPAYAGATAGVKGIGAAELDGLIGDLNAFLGAA